MRVAVAARSFARNAALREAIQSRFPDVSFSDGESILGGDALVAFLRGHDAAIVGLEQIDDAILAQVPELTLISKYGVGLDGVDVGALARRGVKLAWTGGVNRRSVAELTLSFAIALLHRVPEVAFGLRDGDWRKLVGRELSGCTVGIVGCGHVGKDLVQLLAPFGCHGLNLAAGERLASAAALADEPGLLEHGDVLLHRRERHVVPRRQPRHGCRLPAEQAGDDVPPRGVGEGMEEAVEVRVGKVRSYNHMVVR